MSQELQNEKIKLKFFNDDEEMLSVDNSNVIGFEKVYASDPWYLAQPGFIKIKKLIICLVRHWNSIFKIADPFTLTKDLAKRVDGGVHFQADQLRQPSMDQHLPQHHKRKLGQHWRPEPRNLLPPKLWASSLLRRQ